MGANPMPGRLDFPTCDLNVASYLLAFDPPLHQLNGPPGQRALTFARVAPMGVKAYYVGATVDARPRLGALRDRKGLAAGGGRL